MASALALFLAASLSAAPAEPRWPAAPSPAAATAAPAEPAAQAPAEPRLPDGPPAVAPPPIPGPPKGTAAGQSKDAEPAEGRPAASDRGEAHSGEPLPSRAPADRATSEAALTAAARATSAPTPPSLGARALLDELRRTARDRQAEQGSLADQRKKLEALSQEIERSRAALREETAKLQTAVANGARKSGPTAIDTLAKTTRGMKAEQAAAVLTRLDRGLAAAILNHMRPADSALVLEKMEPTTAAALVSLLAGKERT